MADAAISKTNLGGGFLLKQMLGSTGLAVSALGLGTVKFGRNQGVKYPQHFELPSDAEIEHLLAVALDLGMNLLDTAPAYGTSEERLGKLLRHQRHQWLISTKVGEEFINNQSQFDFSASNVNKSVERSLKRLNTDYLDIVLVHSNGDDLRIIEEAQIFTTLANLKKAGKIRCFGMSSKTIAGGIRCIDEADLAMVTYNLNHQEEREVIAHAKRQNKGIFIKKGFVSGHLNSLNETDPIAASLKFIFAEAGVSSVIVGTINPKHLQQNAEKLAKILNRT